jgi:hypothetical protein
MQHVVAGTTRTHELAPAPASPAHPLWAPSAKARTYACGGKCWSPVIPPCRYAHPLKPTDLLRCLARLHREALRFAG